jgi:hypothetical protein
VRRFLFDTLTEDQVRTLGVITDQVLGALDGEV